LKVQLWSVGAPFSLRGSRVGVLQHETDEMHEEPPVALRKDPVAGVPWQSSQVSLYLFRLISL
jgi:hypothetical protein